MTRTGLSGVVAALLAFGCGGGEEQAATPARAEVPAGGEVVVSSPSRGGAMSQQQGGMGGGPAAMPAASCPMLVPDVTVATTEVESGAALTFTTTAEESVDDLRARVSRMAEMVEDRPRGGGMGQGRGAQQARGAGMGPMPPAHAEVVDIEGGARIELHALDARDVDALREHVREHGERMRAGACPMMGATATG